MRLEAVLRRAQRLSALSTWTWHAYLVGRLGEGALDERFLNEEAPTTREGAAILAKRYELAPDSLWELIQETLVESRE